LLISPPTQINQCLMTFGISDNESTKSFLSFFCAYLFYWDQYVLYLFSPFLPAFNLQLKRRIVTIDDYADLPPDEEELLKAVASQPVSVGICGSERAFQLYSQVGSPLININNDLFVLLPHISVLSVLKLTVAAKCWCIRVSFPDHVQLLWIMQYW